MKRKVLVHLALGITLASWSRTDALAQARYLGAVPAVQNEQPARAAAGIADEARIAFVDIERERPCRGKAKPRRRSCRICAQRNPKK